MDADKADDFIAKTFREDPAFAPTANIGPDAVSNAVHHTPGIEFHPGVSAVPAILTVPHPKRVPFHRPGEPVGRVYDSALMGPTNITANVVLELWPDGTVTWRDG